MPEAEERTLTLSLSEIKDLLEAFDGSGATAFKLRQGEFRLELSKGVQVAAVAPTAPPASVVAAAPVAPPAVQAAAPATAAMAVKSPMVGTFYRSPSPDAAPFVAVGDVVKPGQTVCIVEAMKLMNEIEVEQAGRVVRILVDNAQPVEYGQALIELEPV